jgi:ribosome-binding factor A
MVLGTLRVPRGQVRCAQNRENILKKQNRGCKESRSIDPDFAEALYEDTSCNSSGRQAQRKARQFCRQVQRALNLALADRNVGDGVNELFVEDVFPAPDCGRLLVHVLIPAGRPVADAMIALGREAPRLRSEVASAITRKRAPELCFVPAYQDGGCDE